MSKVAVLASVIAVFSAVACGSDPTPVTGDASSNDSAATASQACVDFVVSEDEKVCTSSTDCTFVDATRVCPGDPSCGGQVAINRAGRVRYDRETSAIAREKVSCGVAAPEGCVAGRCVVCHGPADCPDGG
jgi:hypothetical protein